MLASRARRIGVAIGLIVAAVVVAIVALGSGDGDDPPDRYTIAANRLCQTARQELAQAVREHRETFDEGNPSPLARSMFDAVGKLQFQLGELDVSDEKLRQAIEIKETVYSAEQPILDLITIPPKERVVADARELESIESEVREVAAGLGLDTCERLSLRLPPLPS